MVKRLIAALFAAALIGFAGQAQAANCPAYPYTLTNGTTADANQVMANFNNIMNCASFFVGGTSTGTAGAQVLATVSPATFALTSGNRVTFLAGFSSTGATTLNIATTGAIAVVKKTPTGLVALVANDMVANQVYTVQYDGTQYQLLDPAQATSSGGSGETGDLMHSYRTSKTGWVLADGRTIGNAASGATNRANADTADLFTLLWTNLADAEAPVSGGRGASAAADFAANKTITLPDHRGRVIAGQDNMGGTAATRLTAGGSGIDGTVLGKAGGAQTHTLTTAELAAHTHVINSNFFNPPDQGNTQTGWASPSGNNPPTTLSSGSAGSGSAHQNTQPTIVANVFIKL